MYKKIYFIGIGGSGMFPLACICHEKGITVSGYDSIKSTNTEILLSMSVKIDYEYPPKFVDDDTDLVVYSGAIREDDPEMVYVKNKGIKTMVRSKFLGLVMSDYKLIAVSGSHGKSTVSSMITQILIDCGKNPTAIIGAYFNKINGNSILGSSKLAVCEACEYLDSFLDLNPEIGVILNIDDDHLDYFKNIENEKKSFLKFAQKCKFVVVNKDDANAFKVSEKIERKKVVYFSAKERTDFHADKISLNDSACPSFSLMKNGQFLSKIELKVRGNHNIMNSLAAFCVCDLLNLKINDVKNSIENFSGANRRFQFIGKSGGISVFDDFAHHPTEIVSTLQTAKKMHFKRVIVVFQPHTFSRTFNLLNEFAEAFKLADKVILTEILPVREKNIYGIKSEDLSSKIPGSIVINDFNDVPAYLKKNAKKGDMILTMGGGNIYLCTPKILEELKKN